VPINASNIRSLRLCLLYALLLGLPAFAQTQPANTLKPGAPVTREIAGGQKHEYQILLVANQYLRVALDHYGFAATLTLLAPDGRKLDEVEGGNNTLEATVVSALTPKLGTYRIVVQVRESDTTNWRYELQLSELRATSGADAQRTAAQHLLNEGHQLRGERTPEARRAALKKYEAALQTSQSIKDRAGEAAALHWVGRIYHDENDRPKAISFYEQALAIRREIGERAGAAATLANYGGALSGLNNQPKAIEAYQQALQIRRELRNRRGEAQVLNDLCIFYLNTRRFQEAAPYCEPLPQQAQELGNRRLLADALVNLGRYQANARGDRQKAITHYQEAQQIYRALNNPGGEGSALRSIGVAYANLGQFERAIEAANQALPLAREAKNQALQTGLLSDLGTYYGELGDLHRSVEVLTEAAQVWRGLGNNLQLTLALNNLADTQFQLGDRQSAINSYKQALQLMEQAGSAGNRAPMLDGVASIYANLGDWQLALDYYLQALEVAQKSADLNLQMSTRGNIGLVYRALGDYEQALAYLKQALELAQKQKNSVQEARFLRSLGLVHFARGEREEALRHNEQALERAEKAPVLLVSVLNDTALIHNDLKQTDAALSALNRALTLARQAGYRAGEAMTLHNLGAVNHKRDELAQARDYYTQALQLDRELGNRSSEASTLFGLAKIERKEGNLDAACAQIEAALDLVESLRTKVASQELRTSYFSTIQPYYDFYLDLLMQLDKQRPNEGFSGMALQASERARARSLLEMLNEARADIRQGADAQLVQRERELQELVNGKAEALFRFKARKGTEKQVATLERELDNLTAELNQIRTTIKRQSPRYATLTQPQPLTLAEIQSKVLDADTLLLEYALGEERSYLWAVTPDSIRSYTLPKREQIEQAAERVYELLTARNLQKRKLTHAKASSSLSPTAADAQYWRAARELSRMILQPVAAQLGNKRLLVVAEGALQYVPFGALPAPVTGRKAVGPAPLIVRHEIISLPSASTLAVLREEIKGRQPAPKAVAVFADPVFSPNDARLQKAGSQPPKAAEKTTGDVARKLIHQKVSGQDGALGIERLRFTRNEAERIMSTGDTADSHLALDFAANRAALFREELSQYRIVHIATHGLLDTERPELSALIFSLVDEAGKPQDGFLRAHEVFNLNLPAELVVLSACETGLGKQVRGEGLVGLTRGFMYAGAARVVVSLWAVSDEATAELMTKFYRNLHKGGQRPAAALRAAQIEMWRTQRWRAPYFWAAFVMQGEWQ
jgi:CHAT domain-containing protein/Tfp pilus assembly protein PilF